MLSRGSLKSRTCLFVLLLSSSASVYGQGAPEQRPLMVADEVSTRSLGYDFSWYEDTTGELSAREILEKDKQGLFQVASAENTKLSYSASRFWFRFEVANNTHQDGVYLDALNPGFEGLEIYRVASDGTLIKQDNISRRYQLAKLNLAPGENGSFLAVFHSYDKITFAFTLKSLAAVSQRDTLDTTLLSIYMGIFIALILYHLSLYTLLRRRQLLYYVIFGTINAAIALLSVNFPFGIMSTPSFSFYSWLAYLRALGPISTFLFARAFFETKKLYPRIDRLFTWYVSILSVIVTAFAVTGDVALLSEVEDPYFMAGILILMGSATYILRDGFGPAKYFLLGMGAFLGGIAIYIGFPLMHLPSNSFTLMAHVGGQAAEMLLTSFAMAIFVKLLAEEKSKLQATAENKSRLLRIISHDIANPLQIISWLGEMLASKYPDENQVNKIIRSADTIEKVTSYVRRTESVNGATSTPLETVSLRRAFSEVSFLFEKMAQRKGVALYFEMDARDILVMAQEVGLVNEILGNVVSNAIKFSFPNSQVKVSAKDLGQTVLITIKDRGIGMSQETIGTLCHPNTNRTRAGTAGERGTGYGMPIVYSFVRDYGGSIEVHSTVFKESDVKQGTEIRITLRRAKSEEKTSNLRLAEAAIGSEMQ